VGYLNQTERRISMIPKIKKILYVTDLSKNSAYALRYAINSAKRNDAEIVILHVMTVIDEGTYNFMAAHIGEKLVAEKMEERADYAKDRMKKRLNVFYDKVRAEDPEFTDNKVSIEISKGYPAEEILRMADKLNCDMIVMGTHGKGTISQTFLGSMAKKVLHRTRKPVFIIPLPKEESDLTFHDI
jgi:nucleotide-binding universal stress UspA family protein